MTHGSPWNLRGLAPDDLSPTAGHAGVGTYTIESHPDVPGADHRRAEPRSVLSSWPDMNRVRNVPGREVGGSMVIEGAMVAMTPE